MVRIVDDAKSAFAFSSAFALLATATVPFLLPSLPQEAQDLPLPLPLFCMLLGVQLTVVYGLLALAGIRLARARQLEPAPAITAFWTSQQESLRRFRPGRAVVIGLACGVVLVIAVRTIQRFQPGTLPAMLHPPGLLVSLLASGAGSLGEEILFRLLLLSLLLRLLPVSRISDIVAVGISAFAFGAAHAPAFVFLFGGLQEVPAISWLWLIVLNGLCGVTYGVVYLRYGIGAAMITHFGTDFVWHCLNQLLPQ
jgi:membrane protease YdiL (CAAX protease family)